LTSTIVHARAVCWLDASMCCPIARRICEIGSTWSPSPAAEAETAGAETDGAPAAGRGSGAVAGADAA
jgi:hypothetical protein